MGRSSFTSIFYDISTTYLLTRDKISTPDFESLSFIERVSCVDRSRSQSSVESRRTSVTRLTVPRHGGGGTHDLSHIDSMYNVTSEILLTRKQ